MRFFLTSSPFRIRHSILRLLFFMGLEKLTLGPRSCSQSPLTSKSPTPLKSWIPDFDLKAMRSEKNCSHPLVTLESYYRRDTMSKIVCFATILALTAAAKLPKTWKTCKTDSAMNTCLETAIGEAISSMKNGMPSVGVTPLDPLHFDRLMVDQSTGPVAIKLEFKDLDIRGLADSSIKNVESDMMKGHIKFQHYAKSPIKLNGNYTVQGNVLILPIQGKGKATMIFDGAHMDCELKGKLVQKKKDKYFQVDEFKVDIRPKHLTMHFENLFNGNKELGDNMNKFLNENWEEIIKELGPAISKGMGAGFKEMSNRVFQRIPITQIVKN